MDEITLATTMDTDVHAFYGDEDTIRAKADRNRWIETTDGRFVRASAIVCVWRPSPEELEGFMEDVSR